MSLTPWISEDPQEQLTWRVGLQQHLDGDYIKTALRLHQIL